MASDVWAFGIFLFELFTKADTPYPGFTVTQVILQVQEGYRLACPPGCSDQTYRAMRACWSARPAARPPFSALYDFFVASLGQTDPRLGQRGALPAGSLPNIPLPSWPVAASAHSLSAGSSALRRQSTPHSTPDGDCDPVPVAESCVAHTPEPAAAAAGATAAETEAMSGQMGPAVSPVDAYPVTNLDPMLSMAAIRPYDVINLSGNGSGSSRPRPRPPALPPAKAGPRT